MNQLPALFEPVSLARLLCLLMLAILFLQSGLDKIFDRKGNLKWLKGHFAKSPFKNIVPLLFMIVTISEVAAGVISLAGAAILVVGGSALTGYIGGGLSALSILMLFTGQRIAKDYAGAGNLIPYFILTIGTILLCGM